MLIYQRVSDFIIVDFEKSIFFFGLDHQNKIVHGWNFQHLVPEDVSHWELYWVYRKWVLPSHQRCRVKVDDPYVDSVNCSLVISTSARCLQFTSLRFNIISPKDQKYCMGTSKKWADSNPPYCEHFKLNVHWWLKSQGFWELPIDASEGIFLHFDQHRPEKVERNWWELGPWLAGCSECVNRDLGGCSFCKEEVVKSSYPTVVVYSINHPPVITIFICGINHSQMGGLWHYFTIKQTGYQQKHIVRKSYPLVN